MEIIKGSSAKVTGVVYTEWTGDLSSSVLATPVQMVGAVVKLIVKQRDSDLDSAAVLNLTGSVADVNAGKVEVLIAASVTNTLSYQNLVYEILVKLSDGTYHRSGVQPLILKSNALKTLP